MAILASGSHPRKAREMARPCGLPSSHYKLGGTAGVSSSSRDTVGQANRGTRELNLDGARAPFNGRFRIHVR